LLRDWESFPCPQINYGWHYNTAQPDYGKRIASSRAALAVMRIVIHGSGSTVRPAVTAFNPLR